MNDWYILGMQLVAILELCSVPLSKPSPAPEGKPAFKDLVRMNRRRLAQLRAAGTREVFPGLAADVLAEGLAEELDRDDQLASLIREADGVREMLRKDTEARLKQLLHDLKQRGENGEELAKLKRAMRKAQGRQRGSQRLSASSSAPPARPAALPVSPPDAAGE